MAFNRPLLTEIISRLNSDIDSRLPDGQPRFRRSLFGVLARAFSGAVHGLYGFQQYNAQQLLPDQADETNLIRHGSIWGVPRKQASAATGQADVTGTDGSVIAAGEILQSDAGDEYSVDAEVTIAGGVGVVALTAIEAGQQSNIDASTVLTFVNTLSGIDSQATVDTNALTGGADIETVEDWRERILARIRQAPHGGAKHDYVQWALEVAGVTRAWVYPQELGIGTVTVRFVRDDDNDLIPDAAEVQTVQDYIDDLRPVTADLTVVAPVAVSLDFTIALTPNTATVQAAVQAELEDLLRREAEPGGTILISRIREAVSIASGETDNVVTVPAADVTHNTGEMAVMGAITWA